jgi:pimeloyl-ACP methyl ester carboxylesterase
MNITQKTYILVHGAWHGSWCWRNLIPHLLGHGVTIITPNLPGHGLDKTPHATITLTTYVEFITQLIQAQNAPVTLIGHSMAGVVISQVAENIPEKIQQLIYISAFIPPNAGCLLEEAKKSQQTGISAETVLNKEHTSIALKKTKRLQDILYNTCDAQDVEYALAQLQKEPFQPFVEPICISPQRFGAVKKRYIACLQDKTIPPEDQQRMYAPIISDVIYLDADHSPFFSNAKGLADAITNRTSR